MNPLRFVAKRAFDEHLDTEGPSHTFMRICTSRHVDDLQGIATAALTAIVLMAGSILVNPTDAKEQMALYTGLFAAAAGVVSWTFQSGSRRLGAVDLFASEISAICRVCLIIDFAESSVQRAQDMRARDMRAHKTGDREATCAATDPPAIEAPKFTSAEQYTPVYDHNIAELQSLDFDVVKCVTNFYTYRKTMMDLLRRIAVTADIEERSATYTQMIYMQYLMYENGRHAVEQLIEFEPDKSECIINILCSEFVLYGFLKQSYGAEFRGARLDLRLPEYEILYQEITAKAQASDLPAWTKARTTTPELIERYQALREILAQAKADQRDAAGRAPAS